MNFENIIKLKSDFYQAIGETLMMVSVSSLISVILGGLLGVWLYTSGRGQIFENALMNRVMSSLVSFMRSFPFVILMIVLMPVTRLIVGTSFGWGGGVRRVEYGRQFLFCATGGAEFERSPTRCRRSCASHGCIT